jgi:hypothetical protein
VAFRLFIRRSKKVGPFRFNLTKRGVGASVGIPGARYSVHSTGRTTKTVGIPGTGVYWREQTLRGHESDPKTAPAPAEPSWQPDPTGQHEWRWWSGKRWTEHVADHGEASVDPG